MYSPYKQTTMKQMLQICCKNNNIYKEVPIGSSLLDIYYGFNLNFPYQVVSAKVNNRSEGLNFKVYNNKDVEFLDVRDSSGMRTYVRSLCFVLFKAVSELFPEGKLYVEHPVSKGYFCNLRIGRPITLEDVTRIKQRMQEIIAENISYHRIECHTTEAVRVFSERGMNDKVKLLETSGSLYTYYYTLGDTIDYYYGNLLPSTGYLKLFDIVKYYDGLLLRIPNKDNPDVLEEVVKQEKMLDVFKEYLNWSYITGLNNAGDFNIACEEGHATDLINVGEALQEKKIAQIADTIFHRGENGNRVKLVLISGPSSSGKTTFSKRLSIQLMTNGLKPFPISLDNYFVDREETPLDENGNYDYESLYALDLELFNQQLQALLRGEEVELPRFNFSLLIVRARCHRLLRYGSCDAKSGLSGRCADVLHLHGVSGAQCGADSARPRQSIHPVVADLGGAQARGCIRACRRQVELSVAVPGYFCQYHCGRCSCHRCGVCAQPAGCCAAEVFLQAAAEQVPQIRRTADGCFHLGGAAQPDRQIPRCRFLRQHFVRILLE